MSLPEEVPIGWNDLVCMYPEFCQWIVQKFGPLPDGNVKRVDYERFKEAYENAR